MPMAVNKRKLLILLISLCLSFVLGVALFCAFFDIEAFIEGRVRHALEPGGAIQVTIPRGGRLAIYGGAIESMDIRARDVRRSSLAIKELNAHFSGIKIAISRLAEKDLAAVRSLHCEGTALIDEASLSALIGERSPKFTEMSARLLPGIIQVQVTTALFDITLKGNLSIVEGTKINFMLSEGGGSKQEKIRANQLLSRINPVFDVERLDLGSSLLRKVPEGEKKKWEIRITRLQVTTGRLEVSYRVDKRP
jgi:hypothetical protein